MLAHSLEETIYLSCNGRTRRSDPSKGVLHKAGRGASGWLLKEDSEQQLWWNRAMQESGCFHRLEEKASPAAGKDVGYEVASGPLVFDCSGSVYGSSTIQTSEGGKWLEARACSASRFECRLNADGCRLSSALLPKAVSFPVRIDGAHGP
jgi:hypothetical protein